MKFNSKSYVATYSLLVGLLIVVGIIRFIAFYVHNPIYNSLEFIFTSVFFLALTIVWAISISRRILSEPFKRQYIIVAAYLFFFLLVKFVRYRFTQDEMVSRALWYLYYPPMIMLPLNALFATFYLGKEEGYHINRLWYLLYIPAFILSALVITNDYHQLTFHFDNPDLLNWDKKYTYNIVYFLIVAWIAIIFIIVLIKTIISCHNTKLKKGAIIPFSILGGAFIGFFLLIIAGRVEFPLPYSFPDFFTLFVVMFLESLIQVNLIRTNVGYVGFYKNSDLASIITDKNFNVYYTTTQGYLFSYDYMQKALQGPQVADDKWRLISMPLKQGYFFWADDVSYIAELEEKLKDIGVSLDEENAIIQAESELKEKKLKIEKQDEIYNKINELVRNDIIYTSEVLKNLNPDSPDYEKKTKEALISICYIKRRINLFLISYTEKNLPFKELCYSINEILNYVKLYGIEASHTCDISLSGGDDVIYMFKQIYKVILFYLDIAESIFIKCYRYGNGKYARILVDHSVERPYQIDGVKYEYEYDGTTSTITILGGKIDE